MRKIIIADNVPKLIEELHSKLPDWETIVCEDRNRHLPQMKEAEIFIGWGDKIPFVLEYAENLKWIQCMSAGVDSVPFARLRERGIFLTTASGVHANSISETVLGIMMAFSRQLFNIHIDQMNKRWNHDYSDIGGLTEIHDKTIGIVGAGAIGVELARLAKAFNMRTLGCRRSGKDAPHIDKMVDTAGLHTLLAESDYVVNILPGTDETVGLFGDAEFAAMKNTAVYIAVGRGNTTNTDAVVRAMETGAIAGAGLDVVDPEPLPADSPLWGMRNVYIGSHNAGGTDRYMERGLAIFSENLSAYTAGKTPGLNLVDYDLQY
ncbi:MAG: D-2-hydroxyacid dehydrogenase [Oscillospiraceae bacterium]|nr:D-2-hydroxyacid dehydrogenase [Oscillospiraceae bacterium]